MRNTNNSCRESMWLYNFKIQRAQILHSNFYKMVTMKRTDCVILIYMLWIEHKNSKQNSEGESYKIILTICWDTLKTLAAFLRTHHTEPGCHLLFFNCTEHYKNFVLSSAQRLFLASVSWSRIINFSSLIFDNFVWAAWSCFAMNPFVTAEPGPSGERPFKCEDCRKVNISKPTETLTETNSSRSVSFCFLSWCRIS